MGKVAGWPARTSLMRVAAWALLGMLATEGAIVAFVVLWSPAQAAYRVGGRALVWRDGSVFYADGFPRGGPAPRPLDPFPVSLQDGWLYVEPYAQCPSWIPRRWDREGSMRWCDRRAGSPEPPPRCSRVSARYCWPLRNNSHS